METCKLCKGEKTAQELSAKGICTECLQRLFDQIQLGGKNQKKAITEIESFSMIEKMERSILSDFWTIDQLTQEGQRGRYDRAVARDCKPKTIDYHNRSGIFVGSSSLYNTSLTECSCYDFQTRHIPCKHIYRLAYELEQR